MTEANAQSPHPIDRHVGARLRRRRNELRASQSSLASRLGVSFQAVQKYESGAVRLSASRLFELAHALGVAPGYFFEGYGDEPAQPQSEVVDRRAEAALLRGYYGIRNPALQADVRRLIATLGETPG
jgi:transcriptional regulator with XRE-family HTH domain